MPSHTINLPAGKVLTVTAPANSSGSVHHLLEGGQPTDYFATVDDPDTPLTLGPFTADRRYVVTTDLGITLRAEVTQPDEDLGLHSIPVGRILTSANDVVYHLEGDGAPDQNAQASLSTNLTGTNNDLVFTAVPSGAAGNDITVEYIDPDDVDISLSVEIVGNAIKITLATDGDGVITTVGDDISALTDFAALVTVTDKAANDGSGLVIAMAETPLTNGADATAAGIAGPGSQYTDYTTPNIYENMGTKDVPVWKRLLTEDDL